MPAASRFFLLHNALALVLALTTWWLWPAEAALWRRLLAVALSVGLGYQAAAALLAMRSSRKAAAQAWLECAAFPLAMGAVWFLPSALGWALLAGGCAWRLLIRNLWR